MKISVILSAMAALMLGGCAFDLGYGWGTEVDVQVEAVQAPPALRASPHPGKFLLVVQGQALAARVVPSAYDCNAEVINFDLRDAFDLSVRRTVAANVEAVVVGADILPPDELKAAGYAGQIVVTVDPPVTDLSFERRFWLDRKHIAEFWHHASTARLDLSALVQVQYAAGSMVETRVAAERRHRNPDGLQFACENATDALGAVATEVLDGFMAELAARLSGQSRDGGRWLPSVARVDGADRSASPLAPTLRGRTFDLHSIDGDPRAIVDFYDENWRFVRLDGRCARVGRWSINRATGGEALCLDLPGQPRSCYRIAGAPGQPEYYPVAGLDERPAMVAWRSRPGNAEGFRLDEDRCLDSLPY
ncbi:hypothetical protein [Zavarzinia aquatilis]|uniref:hypothetical protein n=1 Tax=Zavarzinia aquatilis TaxID=2211142 RepID=UPI001057D246|nr:hypothetical protein [Zavarzinia aquatilis]